jgi:hypothetical protein
LCRNLYETAGIMHDNGKFRDFVARQQAKEGVKPLHELLCLPVKHISHYVRVYQGKTENSRTLTECRCLE